MGMETDLLYELKDLERGFTLLEILIALSLAMGIVILVGKFLIILKLNYLEQQQLTEIQETAQTLTLVLHHSVHLVETAKGKSCHPHTWINHFNPTNVDQVPLGNLWLVKQAHSLRIVSQYWQLPFKKIVLVNPQEVLVKENFSPTNPVVITDCHVAEVTKLKSIAHHQNQTQLFLTQPLTPGLRTDTEKWIVPFKQETYYIKKTSRVNKHKQPISALYVKNIQGKRYELIPGVTHLDKIKQIDHKVYLQATLSALETVGESKNNLINSKLGLWWRKGQLYLTWPLVLSVINE